MLRYFVLVAALLITTVVQAQQQPQPDPVFMQHALSSLQAQRNQAMDAMVVSDAKLAGLTDDLAKANARIKELEPKKPDPAPK